MLFSPVKLIRADYNDEIVAQLNSSITKSVMVAGAGYLEEYSINKNLYIDTIKEFLDNYYLVDN